MAGNCTHAINRWVLHHAKLTTLNGKAMSQPMTNYKCSRSWSRHCASAKGKTPTHFILVLAATLRWFTAGVQSASLYDNFRKRGNDVIMSS